MQKLTLDKFIEKAIFIHSDKYSYSKVIYQGSKDKVCVICPEHGEFYQSPNIHLSGHGCPKCRSINMSNLLRSNLEEFIKRSNKIHNNKYNYSKVNYINSQTKVTIICSEHGDFEQIPNSHLLGHGCPKCKAENSRNILKLSTEEFIEKAKAIHGNKYDYTNCEYKTANSKISIVCPIHGKFEQTPGCHLFGQGCSKCGYEKNSEKFRLTTEQFIEKAKVVHSSKYEYKNVIYKTGDKKVIITCPKHGDFYQTPQSHLQGHGCTRCNSSKGELVLEEIFKKYNIQFEPQYNIPEIVANYEIDFYLPEYRCLVEFHGIQHYEYISFFHDGKYTFEDQKRRDDMVRDAAIRWKYNYLEFNYKQLKYMSKEEFENLVITRLNKIISNKVITFKVN